jgi:hypothetical protein
MESIEDHFKYFLQRDIVISLDNKILKEGKLVLFSQKDYYLIFYLKNSNQEQKKFELPYPFDVRLEKNYLILDYELEALSKQDAELFYRLRSITQKSKSKYLNNKILLFEKNSLDLEVL